MNILPKARKSFYISMKWIKSNWHILVVLIAGVLASRTLLFQSGYFNMHDDLQMMRQLEMEKCFLDGQIPCRWVPDMGYGFGFPLFNFYPPLPYLTGEIFRLIDFSFVWTVKLTFALSIIGSGIGMYFLAKEFFGKLGGIVSAIFYVFAPYHAVDVYVRGAMNESWALLFFPLILLFSYRFSLIPLALSWAGLLLSHNLMAMIFAPVFAGWCIIWIYRSKKWLFSIYHLALSGLFALGLSAFFTLPAIFEQRLVHVDTLVKGYYEYIAHFADTNQILFSRFWGYGPSIWGEADGMPFQIGHIHWILSIVIGILAYINRKRVSPYIICTIYYLLAVGWFTLFMIHSRSTPIWQLFPPLKFVQFPWRFLTLSTLAFSFLAGAAVLFLQKLSTKYYVHITAIMAIGLIAFNWNYFLPLGGKMGPLTDQEKFRAAAWDLQRTAGIFDYLPKGAIENPKEGQSVLAEVTSGKATLTEMKQGTDWAQFEAKVADNKAQVRINIFDFSNWKITLNGDKIKSYIPEEEKWGRMYVDLPAGEHSVSLSLSDTPIRTVSNLISVATWFLLLFL